MSQDKPYRKAMSKEHALREIADNAGSQFDPYLAELFIEQVIGSLDQLEFEITSRFMK